MWLWHGVRKIVCDNVWYVSVSAKSEWQHVFFEICFRRAGQQNTCMCMQYKQVRALGCNYQLSIGYLQVSVIQCEVPGFMQAFSRGIYNVWHVYGIREVRVATCIFLQHVSADLDNTPHSTSLAQARRNSTQHHTARRTSLDQARLFVTLCLHMHQWHSAVQNSKAEQGKAQHSRTHQSELGQNIFPICLQFLFHYLCASILCTCVRFFALATTH